MVHWKGAGCALDSGELHLFWNGRDSGHSPALQLCWQNEIDHDGVQRRHFSKGNLTSCAAYASFFYFELYIKSDSFSDEVDTRNCRYQLIHGSRYYDTISGLAEFHACQAHSHKFSNFEGIVCAVQAHLQYQLIPSVIETNISVYRFTPLYIGHCSSLSTQFDILRAL